MRLRIHPLCPVMILAALFLGEGTRMAALVFSVTLHELAHILAAYACHVPVVELEMMPCGGAARFDNVWRMRPRVICLVALCGPLTNWLLACISAALGWWRLLLPQTVALLIECNFGLMLFNLLPTLPLDGGRVACLVLTLLIETVTRRKLDPKYEGYIHAAGMVLFMGLMVFVTFHDVFMIFVQ